MWNVGGGTWDVRCAVRDEGWGMRDVACGI